MAATTYAGLRARWMDALATDDADTEFAARLPDLAGDAELRVLRDLDPIAYRRTAVALTVTGGNPSVALPADCHVPRRLVVRAPFSQARRDAMRRSVGFLDAYWPDASLTGLPKYWATPVDGTIVVAPTPQTGTSLALDYTARPAPMSDANPSTWLTRTVPDLLYCAGMCWLAGWSKNYGSLADDKSMAGYWEGRYQAALAAALRDELGRRGVAAVEPGPDAAPPATGS